MEKLKSIVRVEDSLAKLPSIGRKSAERMAYAILEMDEETVNEFVNSIKEMKANIKRCPICGMLTDEDKCPICDNSNRDQSILMVVSYPKDVISLEKSEGFNGLYHVLNGEISLSKGIDINELNIAPLFSRIEQGNIKEIILATNPTIDGETTALYLAKLLEKYFHTQSHFYVK